MSKLRVESLVMSLDGFGAGPDQDINHPLGVGGTSLHGWLVATRTLQQDLLGSDGEAAGIDDEFAARGFRDVGAWILDRHMFGPVRGPWPDDSWRGWWGEIPVHHVPAFVLTHDSRTPLFMAGGRTFEFGTEGVAARMERARQAAAGKDARLGGGVDVTPQRLRHRLVDEMRIATSPVLLGCGERLFEGLNLPALGLCLRQARGHGTGHPLDSGSAVTPVTPLPPSRAPAAGRAARCPIGLLCAVLVAVSGCASTTTAQLSPSPQQPVCAPSATARVLWLPQWRADQKDVPAREAAAADGLSRFFGTSGCFESVSLERLTQTSEEAAPSIAVDATRLNVKVVLIAVRELGPTVKIGASPALVEGGTEVVLEIAEFMPGNAVPRTFTVQWRSGGPGVLKGVASLPQDMQAALAAGLQPAVR